MRRANDWRAFPGSAPLVRALLPPLSQTRRHSGRGVILRLDRARTARRLNWGQTEAWADLEARRPLLAAYSCGRGAFRAAAGQAEPGEIYVADAASGAATVQGGGHRTRQQDGARRLGAAGQGWQLSSACARGSVRRGCPMGK